MRHARRMNSCEDEYEYEEEMAKRRERRMMNKGPSSRNRETFDSDSQNWYHPSNHRGWSPPEDDETSDRARSFERSSYNRSTYGPPYEKRDLKASAVPYSRDRNYKDYDNRRYYREYTRPGFELEQYAELPSDVNKERKMNYYENFEQRAKGARKEYDDPYDDAFGIRAHTAPKDFFYDREKCSFDRESIESYDSNGRRRKSFGSCEMYGSLDSRGREEFRERYTSADRKRSMRRANKNQRSNEEDYEQDSEGEGVMRRVPSDNKSLQRAAQSGRPRKSSGSSPWDGDGTYEKQYYRLLLSH